MIPVSPSEFDVLISEALDEMPDSLLRYLENVVVRAEDEPDRAEMASLGLSREQTLFGVYRGVPITKREANFDGLPDQIVIFRGPILRFAGSRARAIGQIRETVLHEIGHHFGLSDEDLR